MSTGDRDEQRAWAWYDWANSAFVTTTGTVLFAPYLTSVAERAACGSADDCGRDLSVLGLPVSPGSLVFYVITFTTVLSALVLPVVGAVADRSASKRRLLGRFAWVGAAAATAMVLVAGSNWQLGAVLLLVANVSLGASLVVYDAILCDVAAPDERDRVSSRAWAFGYLGGGLLLAANLALVTYAESPGGLSTGWAVRICLAVAGLWWAGFTVIPYRGLRDRPPRGLPDGSQVPDRREPGPRQLRAAGDDAARVAPLPDDADVPGRLPVLQRRHPDRDRRLQRVRTGAARVQPVGA